MRPPWNTASTRARGSPAALQCTNLVGRRGRLALLQHDAVPLDRLHVTQPHHAADASQLRKFGLADRGATVHGGFDGVVDAQQHAPRFEPVEEIRHRGRVACGLQLVRDGLQRGVGERQRRLNVGAVEQPRIARPDPGDAVGIGALFQQPERGVDRGLATPDDHVAARGRRQAREFGGGDTSHAVGDPEVRTMGGGHLAVRPRRVDPFAAGTQLHAAPVDEGRRHPLEVHLVPAQMDDPAAGQQPVLHQPVEVGADLRATRLLAQALVEAHPVDRAVSQGLGIHAVGRGGAVQAHEGIGVEPVPSRPGPAVDDDHRGVALGEQRVREGHRGGSGAGDHIVGFEDVGRVHAADHSRWRLVLLHPASPVLARSSSTRGADSRRWARIRSRAGDAGEFR